VSRTDRILAFATIASVLLHLAALGISPRFDLFGAGEDKAPTPLVARIVTLRPTQLAPMAPVAKPATGKADAVVRAPRKGQIAQARQAPSPAPRWIVRPDDLGAVPPLPDGDLAEAATSTQPLGPTETGNETASGGAAAGGSPTGAERAVGYPVHRARLVYDLSYAGGPVGTVTHTWFTDGHAYRVESVAEGAGLIKLFYAGKFVQRSTGRLGPEGLVPIEYTLQRGSAARSESARFDWGTGKLSLAWKNEHRVVDLPAGTQDALSIVHQAYFMPPTASSAPLEVATSRKLAQYSFELVGETLIETPIGIARAVQIRRTDDDGMRIDVWLDLDRSLLPVRIHGVDRRGFAFEQMIREAVVEK
jgi:Protein of unknown function (DUF3108)